MKKRKSIKTLVICMCVLAAMTAAVIICLGVFMGYGPLHSIRNLVTSSYAGNGKEYSFDEIEETDSMLKGKNICVLGSSVVYGYASQECSIAEYFCARFGCTFTKEAISGTTLVDDEMLSYVSRLKKLNKNEHYDLFICQLSTNDASKEKPLGNISMNDEYDTSTVTGAIEFIINYASDTWGCPVVFFTVSHYDSAQYDAMVKRLYELKEKYGIGVLDLWNDAAFNKISDELRSIYMSDDIHPTKAGYRDWWGPELERQLLGYLELTESDLDFKISEIENVSLNISDITPTGAKLTIRDTNKPPYVYGEWYELQAKSGDEWCALQPILDNYGFTEIGYQPAEGKQTVTFDINWEWLYGELPQGTYRIVKRVNQQNISVAFEIGETQSVKTDDLRKKYPEYYDLPTSKGLEVYVWQMASDSYFCGVMEGTNRQKTLEELMNLKGVSIDEMKEILSSYDISKENIIIIPWQNPVSSYIGEYWISQENETPETEAKRRQQYVDELREMLLDDKPMVRKVSYANWTEDSSIFSCLNADKMAISSVRHFPVYKLDTKEDLELFREKYRDILTFDQGYDEMPSFNEVVSGYDDSFFAEYTVVLAYVTANSGSLRFGIRDIYRDNSLFCLNIVQTNNPEVGTADMAGWFMIAEVPDADLEGVTEFDSKLVD